MRSCDQAGPAVLDGLVTLSGSVVTAEAAPLARKVRLYDRNGVLLQSTISSAASGEWSMQINGSTADRYEVVVVGDEAGERSVIFNDL